MKHSTIAGCLNRTRTVQHAGPMGDIDLSQRRWGQRLLARTRTERMLKRRMEKCLIVLKL